MIRLFILADAVTGLGILGFHLGDHSTPGHKKIIPLGYAKEREVLKLPTFPALGILAHIKILRTASML